MRYGSSNPNGHKLPDYLKSADFPRLIGSRLVLGVLMGAARSSLLASSFRDVVIVITGCSKRARPNDGRAS
jgi:hypothetical protein